MPCVYRIHGLVFFLYFSDHPPPHIHVRYGKHQLVIDLIKIERLRGYLPPKQSREALSVIKENQQFFIEEFNKLSNI
jgi:hypothetical protein